MNRTASVLTSASASEPISTRQWHLRSHEAFRQWFMSLPVDDWLVTTFSCRLRGARTSMNASRHDLVAGFTKAMRMYDFKFLSTSQRKQGIKMMRIPYMGGEQEDDVRYHIHALIELPQGHDSDDVGSYLSNLYQSVMERMYASDGYIVEAELWHKPFDKYDGRFLNYSGRYEGETLSVGMDKVLVPHLVM